MNTGDTLADINSDLMWLSINGYKNVFLDEVTFAVDFIEGASLLSGDEKKEGNIEYLNVEEYLRSSTFKKCQVFNFSDSV